MKVKTLSALAGLGGALIASTSAQAGLIGWSAESQVGPSGRTVWRIYANMSSGTDGISSWGAIGTNMTIQTFGGSDPNGAPSGQFFAGGAPTPPAQSEIDNNPPAAFRSFYTINLTVSDQNPNSAIYPLLNVGMPALTGNSVSAPQDSAATTTTADAPFAFASWGQGNRILLMQLQVTAGNNVRGTIGVFVIGGSGDGGIEVINFNTIPAPGALALLGLAGVVGSRRRRA